MLSGQMCHLMDELGLIVKPKSIPAQAGEPAKKELG
jgi:hypothetical protein